MAREKSSFLDDLLDIFTKLPWWVGALAAILSYISLHQYAISEAPEISVGDHQFEGVTGQLSRQFAGVFQYIIPFVCLLGAGLSLFHFKRKRDMLERQTSLNSIKQLSWREFEELVGEYYRRQGYTVTETEAGPDGGVDLVLQKDTEKTLVQCKQWKKSKVGVSIIREIFGVMKADHASHAIVVTTGEFTKDAESFAKQNNIELIGGNSLISLIGSVKSNVDDNQEKIESPELVLCPKCNSAMVIRVAKKGTNPGQKFWGCEKFPKCRGSRAIP